MKDKKYLFHNVGTYSWLIWARYHHNRGRTIIWLPGPRLVTETVQTAWTKELNNACHRHDEIISPVNNHTKYKKATINHYTPPSQSFKLFNPCGASWQLRHPRSWGGPGSRRLGGCPRWSRLPGGPCPPAGWLSTHGDCPCWHGNLRTSHCP